MSASVPNKKRYVDADETPKLVVNRPGRFAGFYAINTNASAVYLKLFDASTVGGITLGTTVPIATLAIPAGSYFFNLFNVPGPHEYGDGLVVAVTDELADSDTSAITTDIYLEVYYA